MPALIPTDITGTITWLGRVADQSSGIRSVALEEMALTLDGLAGEIHAGRTRPSCSRVTAQHPKGTEIANVRQFSILSAEEMAETAAAMGLEALKPEWLGASIVISGIPDFSHVPPSSRLQTQAGTTLIVDMQNRPCQFPAKEIEKEHPGRGKAYKPAAEGKRGVTAWVERAGPLRLGDTVRLHVPDQRTWQPDMAGKAAE
ncbi:MAG: sulfurase [Roseovarius sp.]